MGSQGRHGWAKMDMLVGVALEIQYGIDGMTQNSFQRMVAIIGRHTAVESEAIAARQKDRSKPRGTYKPRACN